MPVPLQGFVYEAQYWYNVANRLIKRLILLTVGFLALIVISSVATWNQKAPLIGFVPYLTYAPFLAFLSLVLYLSYKLANPLTVGAWAASEHFRVAVKWAVMKFVAISLGILLIEIAIGTYFSFVPVRNDISLAAWIIPLLILLILASILVGQATLLQIPLLIAMGVITAILLFGGRNQATEQIHKSLGGPLVNGKPAEGWWSNFGVPGHLGITSGLVLLTLIALLMAWLIQRNRSSRIVQEKVISETTTTRPIRTEEKIKEEKVTVTRKPFPGWIFTWTLFILLLLLLWFFLGTAIENGIISAWHAINQRAAELNLPVAPAPQVTSTPAPIIPPPVVIPPRPAFEAVGFEKRFCGSGDDNPFHDYANRTDLRDFDIDLTASCYFGPNRVPRNWQGWIIDTSENPGDWMTVWCDGRTQPSAIHPGKEGFLNNDFANCTTFYLQGRGRLHFHRTVERSF